MMKDEIESFLDSFATHQGEPLQRSLIFFPGGMGSELVRSNIVFNPGLPGGSYGYQTLWVDLMRVILEEAALLLQMNGNQDSSNRFILANGALKNCALHPYDNVATWCTANHLDLLMVGWDFRRNADWNVNFFLQVLVPEVRRRANQRGLGDPLKGATLVGHSFGGMVVKRGKRWAHIDPLWCISLQVDVRGRLPPPRLCRRARPHVPFPSEWHRSHASHRLRLR